MRRRREGKRGELCRIHGWSWRSLAKWEGRGLFMRVSVCCKQTILCFAVVMILRFDNGDFRICSLLADVFEFGHDVSYLFSLKCDSRC